MVEEEKDDLTYTVISQSYTHLNHLPWGQALQAARDFARLSHGKSKIEGQGKTWHVHEDGKVTEA